jgi:hypothetical protein
MSTDYSQETAACKQAYVSIQFNKEEITYFNKLFLLYSSTDVPEYNKKTAGREATIRFPPEGKKCTNLASDMYSNGDIYRGEHNSTGERHGLGIMFYANGHIFQARWKNNIANGSGYYVTPDGTEMIGIWKNNLFHGKKNKIRFPSGSVYEGETALGAITGQGVMTTTDGDTFSGMRVNSLMHGHAHIVYGDGNTYTGFMDNNEKCGLGVYQWTNGNVYNGYWYQDAFHGVGVLDASHTHGKMFHGDWQVGCQMETGYEVECCYAEA